MVPKAGGAQRGRGRWAGVKGRAEEATPNPGVEDGDADAIGGEGRGVRAGHSLDQAMEAEAAQVVTHLRRAVGLVDGIGRRRADGTALADTSDHEQTVDERVDPLLELGQVFEPGRIPTSLGLLRTVSICKPLAFFKYCLTLLRLKEKSIFTSVPGEKGSRRSRLRGPTAVNPVVGLGSALGAKR